MGSGQFLRKLQVATSTFGMVSSISHRYLAANTAISHVDLPSIPQYIRRRGNRLPCSLDDGDRLRYLHLLHEALYATGCQLHADVLMGNHVYLPRHLQ